MSRWCRVCAKRKAENSLGYCEPCRHAVAHFRLFSDEDLRGSIEAAALELARKMEAYRLARTNPSVELTDLVN